LWGIGCDGGDLFLQMLKTLLQPPNVQKPPAISSIFAILDALSQETYVAITIIKPTCGDFEKIQGGI